LCSACLKQARANGTPGAQVSADRERQRMREELNTVQRKYNVVLKDVARLEKELAVVKQLGDSIETFDIAPKHGSGTNEGTIIAPAHDWHVEERVDPRKVSGLNEFNLDIAKTRSVSFFQGVLRLTRLLQQDIKVDNLVLPLLGDFVSALDVHEEIAESCALPPMEAILFAQGLLISGYEFLLDNSKLTITSPCHVGNHGRTTATSRLSSENGHSLEYLMYHAINAYFRNEPRIKFNIAEGYHSYQNIYGKEFRYHHGHMIKYAGGIGGVFIPAFKAIAQWNKGRKADYDIFAHFHQRKNGGNFMLGGSLIGFNTYALGIKADYEPPSQNMMLVDKKRGLTCEWPIYLTNR